MNQSENVTNYHVALVNGMAELKSLSLSKPENVKTCYSLPIVFALMFGKIWHDG